MICDGFLHAVILSEICSYRDVLAAVPLLCLLGINRLAIPGRTTPCVAGERFLHAKYIIGILGKFGFSVAGFKNKLCQRNRCKHSACFLVSSKQRTDLLYHIRLRHVLEYRCLQSFGISFFISGKTFVYQLRNLRMAVIQIISRTGFIVKPSVDGHILLVHLPDKRLICFPQKLLNAVTLTDIRTKVNQCGICFVIDRIRMFRIRCYFNCNGTVVIGCIGRTPGAVFLLTIHTDSAIRTNAIVA